MISAVTESATQGTRAEQFYNRIAQLVSAPAALMEVCGTHTMAIGRFGLRARLPADLRLISGPGCPVCVTPVEQIDQVIAMARQPGVTVVTFGDMMRVPGSTSSLERERAGGGDIRIVYSALDALKFALEEPKRTIVFFGIGFETTAPTVAATVVRASQESVGNFCVLPAFKRVLPAMEALVTGCGARINGFICPGHVSAIVGSGPYRSLAADHGIPCVITGFEALDILEGLTMLLEQMAQGRSAVEVAYRRAVPCAGNPAALAMMARVFQVCDACWRGIGMIPASGLELSGVFAGFDARRRIPVKVEPARDLPQGCACGDVMRGLIVPPECPLFGKVCLPENPVGPCMVSSEGACAAYYRYG